MPKHRGRGGKSRRRGKAGGGDDENELKMWFREEGQEYVKVMKMMGDGRCELLCLDNKTRIGRIRGRLRRRWPWIVVGDLVLVGVRDFEDDKVDIIHKYSDEEAKNLRSYGEWSDPSTTVQESTALDDNEEAEVPGGQEPGEAEINFDMI